ncbi:sigma-70 family RNA polymerase sigma factor [Paracidovorax anthurii]|uniref:RNA polymerase sigma-70 factor (ECF subfamily) n=2 Tax=Paracidovorax anthurii TaxID=78229 RepID=A0A328YRM1_9BURK|nr:RNA polymerase sigma-70 factor (ECF subfamily) [Paracidovorax anthurii]
MIATEHELHDLFVAGLDGDAAAYHRFLQRLGALLRGYFRRRLQQLPDEVEDLVQETLMAVHTQRQSYRRGEPLTAWVHAVARYKLVDLWRRRERREALHDPLDDELAVFATADHEAGESRRDLGRLLEQLPTNQRLPIVHTKLEGLSVQETAQLTGMSESAVKVGVHRGLKAMARLWKDMT